MPASYQLTRLTIDSAVSASRLYFAPAVHLFSWCFVTNVKTAEESEQGFTPFTILATFALSQSVALTAVAKGRGHDVVVLCIYALTTTATILWIWWMLRSTKTCKDGDTFVDAPYFDIPTMRFGRMTLGWTLILGLTLTGLGMNDLLPNQSHKVEYKEKVDKKCIGRIQLGNQQTIDSRLERLPILEWLQSANPATERLVIIQQADPFSDSYFDFSLDITCKDTYQFSRRMAFLVNLEGPLDLRPLQFVVPGFQPTNRATIVLHDVEPNDRLLVLVYLQNKDDPGRFDKTFENYDFRFTPSGTQPNEPTIKETQK